MTTPAPTPASALGEGDFPSFTTSTNLGPLTTTLSFAPNCFSNFYDMNIEGLGPPGEFKTQGCCISSCCPFDNFYTKEWAWMTSYYSPGVCPSDYQSCDPPTRTGLVLTSNPGEKIYFCCPMNYMCPNEGSIDTDIPGACGSRLYKSSEPAYYTVLDGITRQIPQATEIYDFESSTVDLLIAYPIQIRVPDTAGTAAQTASGKASSSQSQSPSGTLPIGAIIGIAFGGVFAVVAICTILYFCFKFRKRFGKKRASQDYPEGETIQQSTIGSGPYGYAPILKAELDASEGTQSPSYPPKKFVRAPQSTPLELPGDEHY